jgi:serine/threonine protein kinase
VTWKRLNHPNVVPLLGITIKPDQLVSDWMPGGDLLDHIKNHNPDRLGLVGVTPIVFAPPDLRYQLCDIAEGLCYLHSCNVIHGDLKGVRDSKSYLTAISTSN